MPNRKGQVSKKTKEVIFVIRKALNWVSAEKELFKERLTQPTLFHNNSTFKSELKWSDKFTKRDLIELLTALDSISAITKIDGSVVSFSHLVTSLEEFLNIKLPYAQKEKNALLLRKIKSTAFLDNLKKSIIDKSAK